MDALDTDIERRVQSAGGYRLTPDSRATSHSFSGAVSSSNIDPKTDRAISSELSRVYLDSAIKARIRAVIYSELKKGAQLNSAPQEYQKHNSKDGTDIPQKISVSSLEGDNAELETGRNSIIGGQDVCSRTPSNQPDSRGRFATFLFDTLDLPLLWSPSFLMFAFACTLHMFAFFAPYHMLPIFISLEGRTISCGQAIWSTPTSSVFRIPTYLASPISLTFTIGVAHLLGRLIATFYIEHIVTEPSFLRHYESDESDDESLAFLKFPKRLFSMALQKMADPMILNIISLVIGGICLLFIPLTTLQVSFPHQIPLCSNFTPLRAILFALVFLHTLCSALAISLRSVIAVELIGVHHLTAAFVYLLVFQGTGAIAGPIAIGLLTEVLSGIQIDSQLLANPQYLLRGTDGNPLNWAYYTCGIVFLLSALTYAPLRVLSTWESRRYFKKRKLKSNLSSFSAQSSSEYNQNDASNDQIAGTDSSFPDGASAITTVEGQTPVPSSKRKTSLYDRQHKISTCSRISEHSYITFLMPNTLKS